MIQRMALALLAGMLLTFGLPGSAEAAPPVCATGYRGMPEYDRLCLRTGTVRDGIELWFRIDGYPVSRADRRAGCAEAASTGDVREGIRDGLYDVAYDHFRNHRAVLRVTVMVGAAECARFGFK